jgi:glyoxylase-like metal-dependent hydrolase (beta-lactamase superfamily II)
MRGMHRSGVLVRAAGVCVALVSTALPLAAQPRTAFPDKRGVTLSEFPRFVKLADNVYGYEEIRQPGFTTVSLVVVGDHGVMIVDGQGSPQATQTLLDRVRTITTKPVRWYVVGSDHGDHTAGNSVLPKDVTYIVHPTSRAQLERDAGTAMGQNLKAVADARAKGEKPPPARPPVVVPPEAMSGDRQTVDVGGTEVHVLFLGRAHTGGDLHAYLPRQRILFMSEAYLNRVFPAMRSAYPSEWVKVIDRALAMDVDRYVPGHGFIEAPAASREELVAFQRAILAVIAETRRLHRLGLSPEDAAMQANWGEYAQWMLADQQAIIAIRKIYEELEGTLK